MFEFLKKTTIAAVAALSLVFAGGLTESVSAATAFTFSNGGGNGTGTDLGTVGAFDFGLQLSSNNNNVGGLFTTFTATSLVAETISGFWTYSTNDRDGSTFDPLGYFIDNVFTTLVQLSVNGVPAPAIQNGAFAFNVNAGQSFGFYMLATDGELGAANGAIYGDTTVAAVPLPAGGLLLIGALGGIAALRRRKAA